MTRAGELITAFYEARQAGDPTTLRRFLAADVVWREPDVGDHMGRLDGADAVIDMMTRALRTTGGSFRLRIAELVEVRGQCAAVIAWSAQKNGQRIEGRELAVFSVGNGLITAAQFLPENIQHDNAFWS